MNYSAVRSATEAVRFLLSASALEVLTWKKLGSPSALPKFKLEASDYKLFRNDFKKFVGSWGFNEDEVTRLSEHLLATYKEPVARHLLNYLESVNISNYSLEEVGRWWKIRGKLAHGDSMKEEELSQALLRITQAVQDALKYELRTIDVSASSVSKKP